MTTEKDKARKARAEYMRKWRKENPEKAKRVQERYWAKKYEQIEKEAAAVDQ